MERKEKTEKSAKRAKIPGPPRAKQVREVGVFRGVRIGRRNIQIFAAGLAAIVLGYVVLSLGGESLATILLVGGYLGLLPWAILAGNGARQPAERPPGQAAGE
jgi:hypothetical protein